MKKIKKPEIEGQKKGQGLSIIEFACMVDAGVSSKSFIPTTKMS
ncbi:hypothetical protein [Microcoleus sp. POL10_C6]